MKHSIAAKFLGFLLASFSILEAVGGCVGIVAMESADLYINGVDTIQDQEYDSIADSIAKSYAKRYAADNFSNLSYAKREDMYPNPADRADVKHWRVQLQQGDTILTDPGDIKDYTVVKTIRCAPEYPLMSAFGPDALFSEEESPEATQDSSRHKDSAYESADIPEGYLEYDTLTIWESGGISTYYLYYYEAPEYTVTVYMNEKVLESSALHILTSLYPYRYHFIIVFAVGLMTFAGALVYLLWAAGRTLDGSIRPGGLNRIPLDLYLAIAIAGIWMMLRLYDYLRNWVNDEGPHLGNLSLLGANLLLISLVALGFLFAFAAQIKAKGGYWWHQSLTGRLCDLLGKGAAFVLRALRRLYSVLPLVLQWLLAAALMCASLMGCLIMWISGSGIWSWIFLADLLACAGVILYGGYAFGVLAKGARRMSEGDLSYQIPTQHLRGCFLEAANAINALSETATVAAQNQMRSERMKTELITNVSHDIKTPLTSIINFVDLLQKPHRPEESEQYLEVLSRQSARMKKLIEDLMELSKANSGNLAVNIITMDAAETVNQALGEFSDKLADAGLEPVFRQPEDPIYMAADGRLVWRVLSNLLSNVVKYAMPGTRLYADLVKADSQVLLSLRNVSKNELTVSADDLMERFVRGDSARNSEGSGLGLNIAKSLMEIQGGQLQLLLDGDLFKVTLIVPGAE